MGRLRQLSGNEVRRVLESLGFVKHSQRGSHLKLRRVGPGGVKQTLVIPAHDDIDKGTLLGIFRQACRYLDASELRRHFFDD